jgi:hypothetical protein
MLASILHLEPAINALAAASRSVSTAHQYPRAMPTLTPEDWVLARQLHDVLEPWVLATDQLQSSQQPTVCFVLPIVLSLLRQTQPNQPRASGGVGFGSGGVSFSSGGLSSSRGSNDNEHQYEGEEASLAPDEDTMVIDHSLGKSSINIIQAALGGMDTSSMDAAVAAAAVASTSAAAAKAAAAAALAVAAATDCSLSLVCPLVPCVNNTIVTYFVLCIQVDRFCVVMSASLVARFNALSPTIRDLYFTATLLHPCFKGMRLLPKHGREQLIHAFFSGMFLTFPSYHLSGLTLFSFSYNCKGAPYFTSRKGKS